MNPWYIGTWVWQKTTVHSPNGDYELDSTNTYHYYFTISSDYYYRGYRNGELVHDFLISQASFASYDPPEQDLTIYENCTNKSFRLLPFFIILTGELTDGLSNTKYPFDFYFSDSTGTTYSFYNSFKKKV